MDAKQRAFLFAQKGAAKPSSMAPAPQPGMNNMGGLAQAIQMQKKPLGMMGGR